MLAKSATTIVSINEHHHLDDVTKLCFCVKGQLNCFEVCVCVCVCLILSVFYAEPFRPGALSSTHSCGVVAFLKRQVAALIKPPKTLFKAYFIYSIVLFINWCLLGGMKRKRNLFWHSHQQFQSEMSQVIWLWRLCLSLLLWRFLYLPSAGLIYFPQPAATAAFNTQSCFITASNTAFTFTHQLFLEQL